MNWVIGAAVVVVGAFLVWTKGVYEPKCDAEAAADKRLFDVIMARKLVEGRATAEGRAQILAEILSHCPTMPEWPEWEKVWGNADPLKTEMLH